MNKSCLVCNILTAITVLIITAMETVVFDYQFGFDRTTFIKVFLATGIFNGAAFLLGSKHFQIHKVCKEEIDVEK